MDIKFVLSASSTPQEVRDAIKDEIQRRLDKVQNSDRSRQEVSKRGEAFAYSGIVRFLDNLVFQ